MHAENRKPDRKPRAGQSNAGWSVGQSVALELDVALTAVQGSFAIGGLPEDVVELLRALPDDWRAELPEMLGESRRLLSILETAASLAGVVLEADYQRATAAMRQLGVEEALARLAEKAAPYGVEPDASLPPAPRLVELWVATRVALYRHIDIPATPGVLPVHRARQDAERAVRILGPAEGRAMSSVAGGDLHARFWPWLDRFYYGYYRRWRQARAGALQALEARAVAALGSREGSSGPPTLGWLPAISPLNTHPELAAAVADGRLRVVFLVEPFGLSDLWSLAFGQVLVSFAEMGAIYESFRAFAEDVAARAKALGDPTRLVILRMIRHFGMINTEMAEALGLARPTVSVHAKVLREAGLIRSRREGREVRHELEPEEVQRLFRDLRQLLDLEEDYTK